MSIDVLLPFHKEDDYLYSAIDSVSRSVEVQIRIILIDDRINPRPLTRLPANATIIRTSSIGYARALNAAKQAILSPFTAIMNSDDLVHPERFKTQIQHLEKYSSQLVACGIQKFRKKRFVSSKFGDLQSSGFLDSRVLLLGAYGVDATWCGRSDWWISNIEFVNQPMSDWATGMQVSRTTDIYFDHNKLYYYRQHPNQTTADSSFSSSGLHEIVKYWLNLAREKNIQDLTSREIAWVAAPRGRSSLNRNEVRRISEWLTRFNILTENRFAHLIARRFLLLIVDNFVNKFEVKEVLLCASAALSISAETLSNSLKSRRELINY